jgi:(R)-2-hydroxyisocaproyl-CoA dehydratase beta subunit
MFSGGADEALRFASEVCADPGAAISRWKALTGGKAVGCAPLYVPEEVLHAAGMLPVTVWGNESGAAPAPTIPSLPCSVARGIFASLRGGVGERVDAWVFPSTCGALRSACEALAASGDLRPSFPLVFHTSGEREGGAEYLLDRIEALCEWASAVAGRAVREGGLERSVRIYNENRRRFALIERRMARAPGAYSAAEYQYLARAGMVLPKEAHSEILGAALSRRAAAAPRRAKVFLSGMAAPDAVMECLDAAGASLAGNDLALGHRYYAGRASERGDMAVSLVRRHLGREPCATLHLKGVSRVQRLFARAAAAGADRILMVRIRGCGAEEEDPPAIAREARARGIPFLCLETDLSGGERAAIRIRMETFLDAGA